jgi:hypothetical protein
MCLDEIFARILKEILKNSHLAMVAGNNLV